MQNKFDTGLAGAHDSYTGLRAAVARMKHRNDAACTGSLSAAGTTGYGTTGVRYTGLPKSSTGYDLGIRHAF